VTACLAIASSPTWAAVTIGQVSSPTAMASCGPDSDWVQATVTSGNSYVVSGTGTVTSWTMFGGPNPGDQITMKIWRPVAGQTDLFQVVGHAGPQTITPGGTAGNTFPANVRVQPGDILGFHTGSSFTKCSFDAPGEKYQALSMTDTQDGRSAQFFPPGTTNFRLNIEATFVPDSAFTLAGIQRNKKKGTAIATFNLPNPGQLVGSGKGAKVSVARVGGVGSVAAPSGPSQLLIKAKGKKKTKLNRTGRVKLALLITYTPTGGDPSTQALKIKLKKK
jgi:hypothetical protein